MLRSDHLRSFALGVCARRQQEETMSSSQITFRPSLTTYGALMIAAGLLCTSATSADTSAHAFGLLHESLGNAQVEFTPPDPSAPRGRLTVSNIGSSGQDGVSIDLGEAPGPSTAALFFEGATLNETPTTTYEFRSIGQVAGVPDQVIGTFTAVNEPGHVFMTADFTPIGVQSYRVKIYNGSELVYATDSIPASPRLSISFTFEIDIDLDLGCLLNGCPPDNWDPTWPVAGPIDLGDGSGPHIGDRVLVQGEDPATPPDHVSRLEVLATDAGPFSFIDEALSAKGFPLNRTLGQAHMQANADGLVISNIGSSGQDGVSIELGEAERAGARWTPQPLASTPDGAYYEVSAVGSFGDQPDTELGSTRATKIGPEYEVTADYSALGSDTQLLQIYFDDLLIVSVPGQSGLLARLMTPPSGCDKNPPSTMWPPWPPRPPCFIWQLPDPGLIEIPGVGVFDGNQLRVLAENATAPIDYLQQFDLRLALIPEQQITHEIIQERTTFAGLTHVALGQADLTADGGTLTVSNIGSSGQDGVAIDLGEADGFITGLPVNPALMPAGASMMSQFRGTVDGAVHQPIGAIGLVRSANGVSALPDYSPVGAPTYTVDIYNGDALAFSGSGFSGPEFEIQTDVAFDIDCECDWFELKWSWTFEFEVTFASSGGAFVNGDRIVFTPDMPTVSSAVATEVSMVAAGMPAFIIHDEALRLFDVANRATGQAEMDATPDQLTVSNIGSSGQDGVSIDLDDVIGPTGQDGFMCALAPLPLTNWEPDGLVRVSAVGVLSGTADSPLGSATVQYRTGPDSFFDIATNLAPVGAMNTRVEVYSGGLPVGTAVVPDGLVGTLGNAGDGLPQLSGCGKLPPDPPCFILVFDRDGIFTPIGGLRDPLVGDELRLLADDATGAIDRLGGFAIAAADVAEFAVTGTAVVSGFTVGDLNCDGVISAADIDPFVIALTQGQAGYQAQFPDCNFLNADCNADGTVSAADIDAFVTLLTQ
jgi:hypothetical protein